jgi:hypothetical protein
VKVSANEEGPTFDFQPRAESGQKASVEE